MARKYKWHCCNCGGTNITCDAPARFNYESQKWEIASPPYRDGNHCFDCEDEVRVEMVFDGDTPSALEVLQ